MPQRSNEFQRLIRRIENTMAAHSLDVEESAMLEDLGGTKREIDVLISGPFNGHNIRIAVECRDHNRTSDVTWIDQLIGKYKYLSVDKVIAVSSAKFSAGAKKKARLERIETVAYGKVKPDEWLAQFDRVKDVTTITISPYFVKWREWKLVAASNTVLIADIDRSSSTIEQDGRSFTSSAFGDLIDRQMRFGMSADTDLKQFSDALVKEAKSKLAELRKDNNPKGEMRVQMEGKSPDYGFRDSNLWLCTTKDRVRIQNVFGPVYCLVEAVSDEGSHESYGESLVFRYIVKTIGGESDFLSIVPRLDEESPRKASLMIRSADGEVLLDTDETQ